MVTNNWYECKVIMAKQLEDGTRKKVTGNYLVNAINCTEAEARVIEELTPYCNGDMSVPDIKNVKYSEIISSEDEQADKYFKVKFSLILIDEDDDTEKKSSCYCLVQASSLQNAIKAFIDAMKDSMNDYEINAVQETKIKDVFSTNK